MEYTTQYYFMKNKDWYYYDLEDGMLKLTSEAPEKAKISYEGYLKDEEHSEKIMYGLISDEEDDAYEQTREKELAEEAKWSEEQDALKLFGV